MSGKSQQFAHQAKASRDLLLRQTGRIGLWFTPLVTYFFLWAPILVLLVFSFNDSVSVSLWRGFTTKWYSNIFGSGLGANTEAASFQTQLLLKSVYNSLIVAGSATVIATMIATLLALAIDRGQFPGKRLLDTVLYLPIIIPDITQAISIAVFFKIFFDAYQATTGQLIVNGFATIIIAHIAFNISYVTIVVRARLATMDVALEEAARDLGANYLQTFWHITLPRLLPGISAGAVLAFTLSLDDFVVTFFTSGVGTTTLPVFVYGLLKQRVSPEINAISALMMLFSTLLIGISLYLQRGARA